MSLRAGLGPKSKDVKITYPSIQTTDAPEGGAITSYMFYLFQKRLFYAVGRWWVFYWLDAGGPSVGMFYQSSTDGVTWAARTALPTGSIYPYDWDFITDSSSTLHYVYVNNAASNSLKYRKGTLVSDGTITWTAAEQTPFTVGVAGDHLRDPCICLDSSGQPWIGFSTGTAPASTAKIMMTTRTDGVWAPGDTAAGFPYDLKTGFLNYYIITPLALTGGKIYVVYMNTTTGATTPRIWGILYDNGWGSEETVSSMWAPFGAASIGFTSYAQNDDVFIAWKKFGAVQSDVYYDRRIYGSGWVGAETVRVGAAEDDPVIFVANGKPIIFWEETTGGSTWVRYTSRSGGGWGRDTNWVQMLTSQIPVWLQDIQICTVISRGLISVAVARNKVVASNDILFAAQDSRLFTEGNIIIYIQDNYSAADKIGRGLKLNLADKFTLKDVKT